jgi:hypothetical protein
LFEEIIESWDQWDVIPKDETLLKSLQSGAGENGDSTDSCVVPDR